MIDHIRSEYKRRLVADDVVNVVNASIYCDQMSRSAIGPILIHWKPEFGAINNPHLRDLYKEFTEAESLYNSKMKGEYDTICSSFGIPKPYKDSFTITNRIDNNWNKLVKSCPMIDFVRLEAAVKDDSATPLIVTALTI